MTQPDTDSIRRMLDDGTPIPPWIVRGLCDRVEQCENVMSQVARLTQEVQTDLRQFETAIRPELGALLCLLAAARAWDDAVERCDGIVAAEERLREALRGL
jgi:hypothetical protein